MLLEAQKTQTLEEILDILESNPNNTILNVAPNNNNSVNNVNSNNNNLLKDEIKMKLPPNSVLSTEQVDTRSVVLTPSTIKLSHWEDEDEEENSIISGINESSINKLVDDVNTVTFKERILSKIDELRKEQAKAIQLETYDKAAKLKEEINGLIQKLVEFEFEKQMKVEENQYWTSKIASLNKYVDELKLQKSQATTNNNQLLAFELKVKIFFAEEELLEARKKTFTL